MSQLRPLLHVSASQISTYLRCPRKHFLEKVVGVEVPVHPAAAFGTRGHLAIEHRILEGTWPDDPEAVQRAMAGWKYVPQGVPMMVEAEMHLDDAALPVIGRVDLVVPAQSVIIDHKFISNLRYAKTPAELRDDPQAVLYCTWGLRKGYLKPDAITFRHIVYRTRDNPEAQTTQVQFDPQDLAQRYDHLKGVIKQMRQTAELDDLSLVRGAMESPDPEPCKAYGGCPHLARCRALRGGGIWQPLGQRDAKQDKEMTMDLFSKLEKTKAAQAGKAMGQVPSPDTYINPPDGTDVPSKPAEAAPPPQASLALEPAEVPMAFGSKRKEGVVASMNDVLAEAVLARLDSLKDKLMVEPIPDTSFPPSDAAMTEHYAKETRRLANASTLYIGCLPSGEGYDHLDNWLAPLMAQAAESVGVDHYTQAEYGKGKAALLALIVHKAKAGVPTSMVVDPRSPSADLAIEILRPLYGRVIQRFS